MILILKIICIIVFVIMVALITNHVERHHKKRVNMSFREAMDLTDLPIVTFYNNGNKFNLLLDTGANLSVIDSNALDKLNYEELDTIGTVFGMEGNKTEVNHIKAYLEYKDKKYEETFQVVDMSASFNQIKEESGVNLSGILGSLFFKKYQYILDFDALIAYSKKY